MRDYGIAKKNQDIMDSIGDPSRSATQRPPLATPVVGALKEPSYMPGGGPMEAAPSMGDVMPYGNMTSSAPDLPQAGAVVHDDGGKVNVDPTMWERAKQYTMDAYNKGKALVAPLDNEKDAMVQKEGQVNQVAPQTAAAPAASAPAPAPAIDPNSRYGSRPGEVAPQNMKYNQTPIYDQGGEVDLDGDGKADHQRAYLSDGERVLTPEQATQYENEHPEEQQGAPKDFGGPVFPNPNGIKPVLDTDIESQKHSDTDRLPVGTKVEAGNAPLTTPQGDISNPPTADVQPVMGREIVSKSETNGANPQPYGGKAPVVPQQGTPKQPGYMPGGKPAEPAPDITKMLADRKAEAALKGDLVGLGAAILGEQTIKPVYGGPLAKGQVEPKPGEPLEPGPEQDFNTKMAGYKKAYQTALDEFTPEGKERAAGIREAMLNYEKEHPYGSAGNHPGVVGKIEHGLATAGNIAAAATPLANVAESYIPQSMLGRERQEQQANAMGEQGAREAQENAATEMTKTETQLKKLGVPKELTGDTNVRTNTATGERERAYEYRDGVVRWVPEGKSPLDPSIYAPPSFNAPQQAPVAPATTGPNGQGYVYGEKPDAEHQPASQAEIAGVNASVDRLPFLKPEQKQALMFPQGYKPTVADIKGRQEELNKLAEFDRQSKQDDLNNEMRQIAAQNTALLAQAHLDDEKLKQDKIRGDNASVADSAYSALYYQKQYDEAMKKWFDSPTYLKDVLLVQDQVNQAKNQTGAFSSLGVDTGVGAMLGGPEGAAAGAAAGLIGQVVKGPAEAALDTLKKNGISPQGYDAMQAYFQTIPGRLSFETSVLGVKATAMRMREVIRSLMNTVPSPNTPKDVWASEFNRYYKPMKQLTERKLQTLNLPEGYTKPTRENLGFNAAPKEVNPRPKGATHFGESNIDHKVYYLDGNNKKLGTYYKEEE